MDKAKIIEVLERVKYILGNYENDLFYSGYDNESELIKELDLYIGQIKNDDLSCTNNISLLFAPTGDLQEISIDSGWGREYLNLADIIDRNIRYEKRL